MELILKSDNRDSIAEIIQLAKKLGVSIELKAGVVMNRDDKENLIDQILNFKAEGDCSFGDAAEWQRNERNDRDLPFIS